MEDLVDLIATDASASDISDKIKEKLYAKAAEYVRKRVLQQTDQEIEEIDMQIEDEIEKGILPNPAEVDPITGEPLPQGQDLGEVPTDEDPDASAAKVTDAEYQKDTKTAEI